MEELTERQKLAKAKMEGMQSLAKGIAVDFTPVLSKVKELIDTDTPKEYIIKEIDSLLALIAQLERFSKMNKEEN